MKLALKRTSEPEKRTDYRNIDDKMLLIVTKTMKTELTTIYRTCTMYQETFKSLIYILISVFHFKNL